MKLNTLFLSFCLFFVFGTTKTLASISSNLEISNSVSKPLEINTTTSKNSSNLGYANLQLPQIDPNAFITRWDTRNTIPIDNNNTDLTIPTNPAFIYNYTIDWGDGQIDTGVTANATHTYTTPGEYEVSITGDFPAIYINNDNDYRSKLLEVIQWGDIQWQSFKNAFWGANNLNFGLIPPPDLSRVTDMSLAFDAATNFNGPLDAWDVSNVTILSRLFNKATNFNQPLNTWDVRNVVSASSIFSEASNFNQPLSNWKLESATTINFIFNEAINFNQPLDAWNVSNITGMESVFRGATAFNQPIDSWDVSKVTSMQFMFNGASNFDQPLNSWDVSNVTSFQSMFNDAGAFNQPLSNWNVSGITDMNRMFRDASSFDQPLDTWDVSSVNNMVFMLANATSFNQPLDSWNIGSVTNMAGMLSRTALSKVNYDATLIGWQAQTVQANVALGASGLTFCDAEQQRQSLIDNNGWTITGDTLDCDITCTTITAPQNGAVDVATNTTIIWDAVTSATGYLLSIGTTSGGVDILDNVAQGDVTSYTPSTAFAEGTTLFVTVIPTNGTGAATGCSEVSFTTLAAPVQAPFITRWDTRNTIPVDNNNADLTIPTNPAFTYNYTIDWGDGTIDTGVTANATHTYATPGKYEVSITGDFPAIQVNNFNNSNPNSNKLLEVLQWGDIEWQSFQQAFQGASNLNFGLIAPPDLSQVTNFNNAFRDARSFNAPLNDWDVSNATDMGGMFDSATVFNQPLNTWDVSSVASMAFMFKDAITFNQPLNSWDVSSVTNMSQMFNDATLFNQPIDNWNVSNVTNMFAMFSVATSFNQPLNSWDVSKVTTMRNMFFNATAFNQPINTWDVSSVTNMFSMFNGATVFNQPLNNWNVSSVTNMFAMFNNASAFNAPLNTWDVGNVNDISNMFSGATSFNQPLDAWDVSNVNSTVSMFSRATSFNQPLGTWDVSSVTNMTRMFNVATSFNQPLNGWDISNVTNMQFMLSNSGLSKANYDATLIGWQAQTVQPNVELGASGLTFCDAERQRQSLIDNNGWVITGDMLDCDVTCTTITAPQNGAVDVATNTTITWDAVTSATGYLLSIGTTSGGVDVLDNVAQGDVTSYTPSTAFAEGTTLFVTVIPTNAAGAATGCSEVSFTTLAAPVQAPFITRWDTRNTIPVDNNNAELTIPTNPAFTYNYTIDWGDGQIDTGVTANATHTYTTPGEYEVSITGDFPAIYINNNRDSKNKLLEVVQWGDIEWQSFESAFMGASNLNFGLIPPPDLSQVTNMTSVFALATSFNGLLNNWDVRNVNSMGSMFSGATSFNQPLDTWDVSNVTNMRGMFTGATVFNQPINTWNVSSVIDMQFMFTGARSFNQPISTWDVSSVIDIQFMFSGAKSFNQPISTWDVSSVINMEFMFSSATAFNQPLNDWDISSVTSMRLMLNNSGLSKVNYDATLIGWAAQTVQANVALGADGLTFCDAEQERQSLIDNNGWIIAGDRLVCDITCTNITAPQNGAVDVATNTTITWDAVTSATGYLLSIGTTSGGVDVLDNVAQGDVTSYTPSTAFAEGTTLFVTVIPTNAAGAATGCSEFSFTTVAAPVQAPFITRWDTRNTIPVDNNNADLTIPTNPAFTYNYTIDWGDGTIDTGVTGNATHTYATPGEYEVSITGDFPAIYINNDNDYRSKLLEVIQWGDIEWQSFESAFWGASNLNFGLILPPNLSQVTSLHQAFTNASNFNAPLNDWDVSNITDMSVMFGFSPNFNQPLDKWDMSNVTNIRFMFAGASAFNQPLGSWNTSSVDRMDSIFTLATIFNQPINTWDVSNVSNMNAVFSGATTFNQPLDGWDVSSVTNTSSMFKDASAFNQPLNTWDVSRVGTITRMFDGATAFNQPLASWDVSNARNMSFTFKNAIAFDQPLNTWNVSNATTISSMFDGATAFNQPLNTWDVSNVTDMSSVFRFASSFNQPIENWNISNVTATRTMFRDASSFNQPLDRWDTSKVTTLGLMFLNAAAFNQPLNNWDTSNVTETLLMFEDATSFNQPLNNWDISNVANMRDMLNNSGLSKANYDATLIGWQAQTVQPNVELGASGLTFCDAERQRQSLIDNNGWTITGDMLDCDVTCTTITAPLDAAVDVATNTTITWDAVTNATDYLLSIGTTSGGVDVLDNVEQGDVTSYTPSTAFAEGTTLFVTVIPTNGIGAATGCSEISFTTAANLQAPVCTTITSPQNDAVDVATDTTITWDAVSEATDYVLSIGTTSGGVDVLDNVAQGNVTSYSPTTAFTDNTTLYVTVTPTNTAGAATGCSEISFTTAANLQAPVCTTITAPQNGAVDVATNTTITWDAFTSATDYVLSIGTTSGGVDVLDNVAQGNVTSYSPTTAFTDNTTLYVTVTPTNTAGAATGCSEISFTTAANLQAPICTTITAPLDGAVDVATNTTITWDAVLETTDYVLSIGTTSGGVDVLNNVSQGNVTSYTPSTAFTDNTTLYVTVTPTNAAGAATKCSEISFTTTANLQAPACTTITSPQNGAVDVATNATITWDAFTSATDYVLSIGTTSGGVDVLDNVAQGDITSYTPSTAFADNTILYVTVIPTNAAVAATGCSEINFTTAANLQAPACTTITSPLNGAVDVATNTTITWDAVTNATDYVLSMGTTSGGVDILDNLAQGDVTSYTPSTAFADNTILYVTVTPTNATGAATGCSEINFTTAANLQAPACTTITSPLNGAVDVATNTTITWDAVANATDYVLSIGTTSGGVDVLDNVAQGNVTSYTPSIVFADNKILYVTVTPTNAAGAATGCSEISFTTDLEQLDCPSILSPLNQAIDISLDAVISWNGVVNANGYRITIGTTLNGIDIVNDLDLGNVLSFRDNNLLFPEGVKLYVNVTAYNNVTSSVNCFPIEFDTLSRPLCTSIFSPENTATSQPIDAFVEWQNINNASGYFITIGTESGLGDVVDFEDVNNTNIFDLSTINLDYATTYYVSVTPYNAIGVPVNTCSETAFTTMLKPDNTKFGISPNGDNVNDFWVIDNIERFPDNEVFIYNRWGDLLYQTKTYNNRDNVFAGVANRSLNKGAGVLPDGTYYFFIKINGDHNLNKTKGYIVIKR